MNTLVCGRMKEGKTSFGLWLARQWTQQGGTVAWDPRHMIDEQSGANAGFSRTLFAYNADDLQEEVDQYEPSTLIVYRPTSMDQAEDFRELCSVLLDPPERYHRWSLLVDEAAQLQSSHTIVPELSRAIRQHPRSVLIVQTTHSLQDWHRASKDLTNHLFCFRLVGRSLRAVIDFCDGSPEMETTIRDLPPHTCVHINFESRAGAEEFAIIEPGSWFDPRASTDPELETEEEETEEDFEEEPEE